MTSPSTLTLGTDPYVPFRVRVRAARPLGASFVRVTLTGPELDLFADNGDDQRFKLVFPLPGRPLPDFPPGTDWYAAWLALPVNAVTVSTTAWPGVRIRLVTVPASPAATVRRASLARTRRRYAMVPCGAPSIPSHRKLRVTSRPGIGTLAKFASVSVTGSVNGSVMPPEISPTSSTLPSSYKAGPLMASTTHSRRVAPTSAIRSQSA